MTIEAVTALIGVLAWPFVVLLVVGFLRREIAALFGRVRQIEGPGDLKVSLDAGKVEQIIKEGRKENAPASEVAERIVQSALDRREARIMRALFDDSGRSLFSYQSDYYRPALESLMAKGYVRKLDKSFALTQEGLRATRDYLLGVLKTLELPDTANPPGGAKHS